MSYSHVFVDLDGTLVKQNASFELFKALIFKRPFLALKVQLNFIIKRKNINIDILNKNSHYIDFSKLEFNHDILNFIKQEKKKGKKIILATGSPEKLAKRLNFYLNDLFDHVIGSCMLCRCVSKNKLNKIKQYTKDKFMYIGDSLQDIEVWRGANLRAVIGSHEFIEDLESKYNIQFDHKFLK